jgi:hypothetical protein
VRVTGQGSIAGVYAARLAAEARAVRQAAQPEAPVRLAANAAMSVSLSSPALVASENLAAARPLESAVSALAALVHRAAT